MALSDTLRLFAALLGAGLSLFLGIVLRGQRTLSPAGALVWRIVVLLGVFNALMTLSYFKALAMGRPQAQGGPLAAAMMAWLLAMLAAIWLQFLAVRAGHRKFAWGFALALALTAAPPVLSLRIVDSLYTPRRSH